MCNGILNNWTIENQKFIIAFLIDVSMWSIWFNGRMLTEVDEDTQTIFC